MSYPSPTFTVRYWDVGPKSIQGQRTNPTTQLTFRGDSSGLQFSSSDNSVASVNSSGLVTYGGKAGRASISVWEDANPTYVRTVAVEVTAAPGANVQTVGEENAPGESDRYAREDHQHEGVTEGLTIESLLALIPDVAVLPALPSTGILIVRWCDAAHITGGTGDNQLWIGNSLEERWYELYRYTAKSGEVA